MIFHNFFQLTSFDFSAQTYLSDTTTPMTGKLTKNHILVLSDSKCNEQNPCPNNYCCLRETCISEELIEYCPNSATATATATTTTTTTTGCTESIPCPIGYCCVWYHTFSRCEPIGTSPGCPDSTTSTTTATTTTTDDILPDYECNEFSPCPNGYCCWWDFSLCISLALGCPDDSSTTSTIPTEETMFKLGQKQLEVGKMMAETAPEKCDENHPCQYENYCCDPNFGFCVPLAPGEPGCPNITTTTTTISNCKNIPDFGCTHHNPCPGSSTNSHCCELETGACLCSNSGSHECPKVTSTTTTTIKTFDNTCDEHTPCALGNSCCDRNFSPFQCRPMAPGEPVCPGHTTIFCCSSNMTTTTHEEIREIEIKRPPPSYSTTTITTTGNNCNETSNCPDKQCCENGKCRALHHGEYGCHYPCLNCTTLFCDCFTDDIAQEVAEPDEEGGNGLKNQLDDEKCDEFTNCPEKQCCDLDKGTCRPLASKEPICPYPCPNCTTVLCCPSTTTTTTTANTTTLSTTMTTKTTTDDILPDYECNEFSPCPSGSCCWRGTCCELLTGTCDSGSFQCDYTTTTTTSTTVTTTPDIIPDFECSHHNPCPWGYCCELLTGVCYSGYEEHECPFSKKSVEDFFLAH